MFEKISKLTGLHREHTLLDICCGTGSIGLCLASRVGQVIGVDIMEDAVIDARLNANKNNVNNAEFIVGPAEDRIPDMINKAIHEDIVAVIDPPRPGLAMKALRAIRNSPRIKKVMFLSSDSRTSMKNLVDLTRPASATFKGDPFMPISMNPVDLFPHTTHTMTLFLFMRVSMYEMMNPHRADMDKFYDPVKRSTSIERSSLQTNPSIERNSPVKTAQPPRPTSSLDNIRSYYTKETTPGKGKEDRESSLSKAQVDWLNQMTDGYGERFERAKWVENFIKQNHDAALKQKAASQGPSSDPAPSTTTSASPSKPTSVEIPPMPPWPCAPKSNDPIEHEKYKKDYDAYSYWYNTYGTLYAAQQKALQQGAVKPTAATPEVAVAAVVTRQKTPPKSQPSHPGYSTKAQSEGTTNPPTLPDPNAVPAGTDPAAWRKYCKDTEEYWSKQAGQVTPTGSTRQVTPTASSMQGGADAGRKAVQEKAAKMMGAKKEEPGGYNYTQYKGQPEKYEQKPAPETTMYGSGQGRTEDDSGQIDYSRSFSGQRRETGGGDRGGSSQQRDERAYGGNAKQSSGQDYYENSRSGHQRGQESFGERGFNEGNRSNSQPQGRSGNYGDKSREYRGDDHYGGGNSGGQDYDDSGKRDQSYRGQGGYEGGRGGGGGGYEGRGGGGGNSGGYEGGRGGGGGFEEGRGGGGGYEEGRGGGRSFGGNEGGRGGYEREDDIRNKEWGRSYGGGDRY